MDFEIIKRIEHVAHNLCEIEGYNYPEIKITVVDDGILLIAYQDEELGWEIFRHKGSSFYALLDDLERVREKDELETK